MTRRSFSGSVPIVSAMTCFISESFNDAKGFGFDAALTLGGELHVGFAYAARLSFDYFKPQFAGFPPGMLPPALLPSTRLFALRSNFFPLPFRQMMNWL